MGIEFFENLTEEKSIGGKGASLVKLYKNNFNVPNGYIIKTNLFDEFLKENNIKNKILNLLNKCNIKSDSHIEETSNKICSMISKCNISEKVSDEIINYYKRLECKYVAVRSSATSEDGKNYAWAGQLETFLNVNEKTIIDSVKKCWMSVFSKRAIFYRIKNKDTSNILVAVVVQKMIQSEISGVSFSINPSNNNKDEIMIESVLGLGEAIVSGSVTPDNYIVDKNLNKIKNININNQKVKLVKKDGKNEWQDVKAGSAQKLDDRLILELSNIIKNLEDFYKFPVDVEWGVQDGKIYILQCRPITTFYNDNIIRIISKIKKSGIWKHYVSRKFNWFLENTQIYGAGKEAQEKILGFNLALKNYLILNGDEYSLKNDFEEKCRILRNNFDNDINFFDDFANKEIKLMESIKEYINKLKSCNFSKYTISMLEKEMITFSEIYINSFVPPFTRPEDFLEEELKNDLRKMNFKEEEVLEIFSKIATCSNELPLAYSEEPLELLNIALKVKNGENVSKELDKHIEEYSWMKAPLIFEDTCFTKQDYLERLENLKDKNINEKIAKILEARKQNDIDYELILKKYSFSTRILKLSEAIRKFILLRTYTTEISDKLFFVARHTLFVVISKVCNISVDDLIMLGAEEILEILKIGNVMPNIRKKIFDRREGYAIIWLNGEIETFIGKEVLQIQAEIGKTYKINNSSKIDDNEISGMSANGGIVIGNVKILLNYKDVEKVKKGDIIVATMTTPDYISAMEKASGFITDEGGITCHAAIISREFGVPCIVGTVNATSKLKDGQKVELDAYNGIVKLLD